MMLLHNSLKVTKYHLSNGPSQNAKPDSNQEETLEEPNSGTKLN